jgi:hypothetical protein
LGLWRNENEAFPPMWMEKVRRGVLQVATDTDLRYVEPSLSERLRLLWTFRNFHVLSEEILTGHERHLMQQLCAEGRLQRPGKTVDPLTACVIGTVEWPAKRQPCRSAPALRRNSA